MDTSMKQLTSPGTIKQVFHYITYQGTELLGHKLFYKIPRLQMFSLYLIADGIQPLDTCLVCCSSRLVLYLLHFWDIVLISWPWIYLPNMYIVNMLSCFLKVFHSILLMRHLNFTIVNIMILPLYFRIFVPIVSSLFLPKDHKIFPLFCAQKL